MSYARGVDVSSHQGSIDWGKVASSWQFALARMTIGRTTLDQTGVANLQGMLRTSIVPGAYGVVGTAEPVEDGADLLIRQITAAGADPARTLVMLDAEDFSDGTHPTIGQVDRYARRLHDLIGRWPVAYVPLWWLGSHAYTVDGLGLANCPWAQSRYYTSAYWTDALLKERQPSLTHGWKRLAWLQYTDAATVGGISGGVDANVFYGTSSQLRAQLLGQSMEAISMADAQDILDAVAQLRHDLVVTGTTGLADTQEKLYGHAKGAHLDTAKILTVLADVNAKLDAGLSAGLTPEQVADIKKALTLEGTAMVQLAVSPPA